MFGRKHLIRKKLVRDHKEDCRALTYVQNGSWNTVWFPKGEFVFRSRVGNKTKRGCNYAWLVFECNCFDCNAQLIIHADDVLEVAEEEIKSAQILREDEVWI